MIFAAFKNMNVKVKLDECLLYMCLDKGIRSTAPPILNPYNFACIPYILMKFGHNVHLIMQLMFLRKFFF